MAARGLSDHRPGTRVAIDDATDSVVAWAADLTSLLDELDARGLGSMFIQQSILLGVRGWFDVFPTVITGGWTVVAPGLQLSELGVA